MCRVALQERKDNLSLWLSRGSDTDYYVPLYHLLQCFLFCDKEVTEASFRGEVSMLNVYWRKKATDTAASSIFNVLQTRKLKYVNADKETEDAKNYDSITIAQARVVISAFWRMNAGDVKPTSDCMKLCTSGLQCARDIIVEAANLPPHALRSVILTPVENVPWKLVTMSHSEFRAMHSASSADKDKDKKLPPLPLIVPGALKKRSASYDSLSSDDAEEFDDNWTPPASTATRNIKPPVRFAATTGRKKARHSAPDDEKKAAAEAVVAMSSSASPVKDAAVPDAKAEFRRVMSEFDRVQKKLADDCIDAELEYNAAKEKYEARMKVSQSLRSNLKSMKDTLTDYAENGLDGEGYVAVCDAWLKHALCKK